MDRREFLAFTGLTVAELAWGTMAPVGSMTTVPSAKSDFAIRIAPVRLELAPGNVIETVGYNGVAPGPILRMREGKRVTVDVRNDTDVPELVHWHGQFVPSDVDGSEEEGTPFVPAHGSRKFTFTPEPAGTRWYHTHAMAGSNLNQGGYTGQFGFLYVEPKSEPGNYDREIFLAAHHWGPSLAHKGPGNNGWEVAYSACSLNDRALGHGEPVRVRQGQRVLFHFLNASATEDIKLALPGHQFNVIALDGNSVPSPRTVEVLQLAIAERIDAIVEMNQPGAWILGSPDDDDRDKGMGVVVEYAGQRGEPQWVAPAKVPWDYTSRIPWDYTIFGSHSPTVSEPDGRFDLTFVKIPGERVTFNRWTINGKQFPDTDPLVVKAGKRYRLAFNNDSGDTHPIHLHRHSFEITKFGGKPTAGIVKDIVNVPGRSNNTEVDFVANNPGPSLLHCHMQLHMDFGFKTLVKYT
jgi:FtsP/CotA-like multicopper oxidase with cupredoxin domain